MRFNLFSQRKEEKEDWETVQIGEKKGTEKTLGISGSGNLVLKLFKLAEGPGVARVSKKN